MNTQRLILLPLALILVASSSGCTVMAQKLASHKKWKAEKQQLKADMIQAREEARQAELEHERDCIRAELDQCKDQLKGQFQQRLNSKISIDMAQQLEVSDIKIDAAKLQPMLAEAQQADATAKAVVDEENTKRLEAYANQLRDYVRQMRAYEAQQAVIANNCGTPPPGCCVPAPPCMPKMPVLQAQQLPAQQNLPLKSVPLLAELKLNVETRNPRIEQGRQQILRAEQPPCTKCGTSDCCCQIGEAPGVVSLKRIGLVEVPPAPESEVE